MPDAAPPPLPPEIPEAVPARQGRLTLHLVWVLPLVAAAIGGWLALQAWLARGPEVVIRFQSAEGIEVGKTRLKYKNVDIGLVKRLELSADRSRVLVHAEIDRDAAAMLVDDTRFWVVRPRVAVGSISGLSTLLSGSYIGMDVGKSSNERRDFQGLEVPPVVTAGLPGRQYILRSEQLGSLDIGSPVYYRRIEVGHVVAYALDRDGQGITVQVFINAPYQRYVTSNVRFWQASGLDVTLDATGFKVDTQSLATIVAGGIAFEAPPAQPTGPQVKENTVFQLADDRVLAMKDPDRAAQRYRVYFEESLRGLSIGAPIDLRGLPLGEVKSFGLEYDAARRRYRFPVEIALYPERLRAQARGALPGGEDGAALLDDMVAKGLRAQLRSGNLLTGQMHVALDFFPKAPPAAVDRSGTPWVLPSTPGSLGQLQDSVANIVKKVERIPFEELAGELRRALGDLDGAIKDAGGLIRRLDRDVAPPAAAALQQAERTLQSAERVLAQDAPLQQDLRGTLGEVKRAADSLRNLTDYLERHPESLLRGKPEDPK